MTKRELREAAEQIGRLLATVDRGELACPRSLVTRLDGARVALAALGARGGKPGDMAGGLQAGTRPVEE